MMNAWPVLVAPLLLATAACSGEDFASASADAASDSPSEGALSDSPVEAGSDAAPDAPDTGWPDTAAPDTGAPEIGPPDGPVESGPPCPTPTQREVEPQADGVIITDACHGANSYLYGPFANIGIGRGLFRFVLDDETVIAFHNGTVISMRLELTRNQNCEGDNNCPATGGPITAFPLRNDWVEGSSSGYTGADWCRRTDGNPGEDWNAPGADADHGAFAGKVTVDGTQPVAKIELDPMEFTPQWLDDQTLSVLLVPGGGTFVAATRESAMWPHPRLVVQFCQ